MPDEEAVVMRHGDIFDGETPAVMAIKSVTFQHGDVYGDKLHNMAVATRYKDSLSSVTVYFYGLGMVREVAKWMKE